MTLNILVAFDELSPEVEQGIYRITEDTPRAGVARKHFPLKIKDSTQRRRGRKEKIQHRSLTEGSVRKNVSAILNNTLRR